MNSQTVKLILISIFYPKDGWHHLLRDCLFPTITSNKVLIDESKYYIHFCTLQGYHLRLSVVVNSDKELLFKDVISKSINEFLISFPSVSAKLCFPLDGFFMNYPNNSLQYNIYRPYPAVTSGFDEHLLLQLRNEITLLIKQKLVYNVIDDDTLLSAAIEIQSCIAKGLFNAPDDWILNFVKVIMTIQKDFDLDVCDRLEVKANLIIKVNSDDLLLIAKNLLVIENYSRLCHLCQSLSHKSINRRAVFLRMNSILFEHLGLQKKYLLLLSTKITFHVFKLSKLYDSTLNTKKQLYEKINT